MLDRKSSPHITNPIETEIDLPQIEKRTLMTGLPLYIYEGGAQEVFRLQISIPCGYWTQDRPLQAGFTASMMKLGTHKKTSAEIAQIEDFYGASIVIGTSADYFTVTVHGLSKYMVDLMILVKEIMLSPAFSDNEFQNLVSRSRQNYQINITKSDFVAGRSFDEMLYGRNHPYGIKASLQDYESLTRDDIAHFYENILSLEGAKVFITGNFESEDLLRTEDLLNDITLNSNPPKIWNYKPSAETQELKKIVVKEDAVQAAIAMGRLLFELDDPDYIPYSVLNTAFGGYFGSRLMSNIREDKGYTYGVYSRFVGRKHGAKQYISTDVNLDVVDDTFFQIRKEMDRLMQDPMPEEELLLVKNYLFSSLISSIDGPFKIMDKWRWLILNDLSENRFDQQAELYRNINTSDIQQLAQKYYADEDMYRLYAQ